MRVSRYFKERCCDILFRKSLHICHVVFLEIIYQRRNCWVWNFGIFCQHALWKVHNNLFSPYSVRGYSDRKYPIYISPHPYWVLLFFLFKNLNLMLIFFNQSNTCRYLNKWTSFRRLTIKPRSPRHVPLHCHYTSVAPLTILNPYSFVWLSHLYF